jgi:hypothetical protein
LKCNLARHFTKPIGREQRIGNFRGEVWTVEEKDWRQFSCTELINPSREEVFLEAPPVANSRSSLILAATLISTPCGANLVISLSIRSGKPGNIVAPYHIWFFCRSVSAQASNRRDIDKNIDRQKKQFTGQSGDLSTVFPCRRPAKLSAIHLRNRMRQTPSYL